MGINRTLYTSTQITPPQWIITKLHDKSIIRAEELILNSFFIY